MLRQFGLSGGRSDSVGPLLMDLEPHPVCLRLARLVDGVADGALTLRVADVLPLDEAAAAHTRPEKGGVRARLVFKM